MNKKSLAEQTLEIVPDFTLKWGVYNGTGWDMKLLTDLESDHLENILVTQNATPTHRRTIIAILKERHWREEAPEIELGEFQYEKVDDGYQCQHDSVGGTIAWCQKILDAGLNGCKFKVILRKKC